MRSRILFQETPEFLRPSHTGVGIRTASISNWSLSVSTLHAACRQGQNDVLIFFVSAYPFEKLVGTDLNASVKQPFTVSSLPAPQSEEVNSNELSESPEQKRLVGERTRQEHSVTFLYTQVSMSKQSKNFVANSGTKLVRERGDLSFLLVSNSSSWPRRTTDEGRAPI